MAYLWYKNPQGNYEPIIVFVSAATGTLVLLIKVFRKNFGLKRNGRIASLIPSIKHWLNRPIIVSDQKQNWWHKGRTGDQKPAMQIASYWYVTNPTEQPIRILNTYIDKPRVFGHVSIKDVNSQYYGSYSIPPHATTNLHADFSINPPIRKEGQKLKLNISFVDQYGKKRKFKNVEFESDKKRRSVPKSLQTEAVYELEHDTEKKIASVLKDEINRYKKYGRCSGELGSVYAMYNGRKIKSIYQDGWTSSKSGERQEIVSDPQNSRIYSENGEALVNYYKKMQDDKEKELFRNSLISRLNREKEYYCVSYLILYVLFRIGRLDEGFAAAEIGLMRKQSFLSRTLRIRSRSELLEHHQRYGFSDFLGMLNGLLRYEHSSFTDKELDLIEKFIESVKEHTFRIEEKINSIRSFRLSLDRK